MRPLASLAPILPFEPEAVLFDMDGLLFDSERMYRGAFFELLEERDLTVPATRFVELVGLGWSETCDVLADWLPELDADEFVGEWKFACRPENGRYPELKPGAIELLAMLNQRGVPAAIATGAQRAVAEAYLVHHGMTGHFRSVIASEDCGQGKPNPEPFQRAATSIDCDARRCLALEDSLNGIRSARAAGCHAIFVPDLIPADDEIADLAHGIAPDLHEVRAALE